MGAQSVIEVQHDGDVYEFVGILRDYSPDFVELLDVYLPRRIRLHVTACEEGDGCGGVEARIVVRLDMIFPRATSLIRHRAERYETVDAFMRAFQVSASKARDLMAQRVGILNPSADYQALLLNRPEVFASDEWLSDALDRRQQIEQSTRQKVESAQCRQQREQAQNETPS